MRVLLDSHVLLWWVIAPTRIESAALAIIEAGDNDIFYSAASVWELCIKQAKGKLCLPDGFVRVIAEADFHELPITSLHARCAAELPGPHRDPFDRVILAQAQIESCVLLTRDKVLRSYEVPTLLA